MDRFNLNGKIAVITGGAGLLGTEHAFALAEKNALVVAIDLNKKKLEILKKKFEKKGHTIDTYKGDITKPKNILKIKNDILKKYKKIDILINNAQLDFVPKKKSKKFNNTLENYSLKKWDSEINVGLKGAFICSKIFGIEMLKKRNGVILNIASDLSVIAPDQRIYKHLKTNKPISYSVIKHGLIGLTKYLASYWSSKNIRVNALSPGGVYNYQEKIFIKKIKKLIPMNRMANVSEYKEAIQFLCSDASSYMTGHNLIIDGGRTLL
jgi:NAD(P)-dependent dehydrogenase (short-subunit alcohol dehydrogenase family)